MFIEELSPNYVPVNVTLTKEEKDSIRMVVDILEKITAKEIEIYNCYEEELTYKLEDTMEVLDDLINGFPDLELRLYK